MTHHPKNVGLWAKAGGMLGIPGATEGDTPEEEWSGVSVTKIVYCLYPSLVVIGLALTVCALITTPGHIGGGFVGLIGGLTAVDLAATRLRKASPTREGGVG